MKDEINAQNLKADELSYGKWASRGDQFADEEQIRLLFDFFVQARPELTQNIQVIEYGSAEGKVGEFFKKKLSENGHDVHLILVDVIKEHLWANKNEDVKKICVDLLDMNLEPTYDLGIGRSILHYFSEEGQKTVLKNIYNSLRAGGYYLSQNFVQSEMDLGLYLKLNHAIGKSFVLTNEDRLEESFRNAGFSNIKMIGALPVWDYSSESLKKRYALSDEEVMTFRKVVEETPEDHRSLFKLTETGFTIPIPYKVFLMQK